MATTSDSSNTDTSNYGGDNELVVVGNDANDVSQQGEDKEPARETEAADQTENEAPTQASRGSPQKVKKRRRESKTKRAAPRSNVWNHYERYDRTLYIEKDGKKEECGFEKRARCKYCSADLAADSSFNGTSTLRRHVEKVCKKYPGRENLEDTQQVLISDGGVEPSINSDQYQLPPDSPQSE
ncbi:uncharacterized protein LOC112185224 [Rosa chinensis]|uniref:uncharacterized protein LOC112185224 n=1 Tax=Rosa chinensis TaxID=74649 RepID=UPI000D0925B9|nr:uncharacterized protein LOC112185224 [Rosa chinensis]